MKRFLLSVCLCLGLCAGGRAQVASEDAISYQAIARDASGQIIAERPIGVKVEILQGSTEGAAIYSETHEATTSPTGVVNLSIGNGTEPSGAFSDIDWGASTYFLRLSMDTEGSKEYKEVSTTQIMPVPYALYAKKAGNVKDEIRNIRKYIIIDRSGEDLNEVLLTGNSTPNPQDFPSIFYSRFTLVYLDKSDSDLTVDFAGFSDDVKVNIEYSNNSFYGKTVYISCQCDRVLTGSIQESVKFQVKDKNGNILDEYPLNITYNK